MPTRSNRPAAGCRLFLLGSFATISLLGAAASEAAVIQGQFTGIIDRAGLPFAGGIGESFTGTYSYDDTALSIGIGPGSFADATLFPALTFEIDGASVGSNPAIWIIDGAPNLQADSFGVLVLNSSFGGGYPALGFSAFGGLWSAEDLSSLNGRVFSDFSGGNVSTSPVLSTLPRGRVTAWSQTVVPEPGTGLLLMLGIAGLASGRRPDPLHPAAAP